MERYPHEAPINTLMTSSMLQLDVHASYDKARGELVGFGTARPH
jgi:hypothetical protein